MSPGQKVMRSWARLKGIKLDECCSSRTAMIATISMSPHQYHHTVNTLKYADRAKEIKTHVRRNQGTVQEHISKLRSQIAMLQKENAVLKSALQNSEVRTQSPQFFR